MLDSTITKIAVSYRRATAKDIDALQALKIASYSEYESVLTLENWTTLNGFLHNKKLMEALANQSTVFVCEAEQEIVGMAFIVPSGNPTPIFSSDWSHIRMVGVHPRFRGQGIAKMLTQMCVHHARITNEKTIALHTSEFMDAARHIYESLGFKVLKEIAPLYGKMYWIYTLELSQK